MREHEVDALRDTGGVSDGQHGVGAGRLIGHENAVEAGFFVRLGEVAEVVDINCRTARQMCLGHFLLLDHADEFDAHERRSSLIHTVRQCVKRRFRTLPIALKANIG